MFICCKYLVSKRFTLAGLVLSAASFMVSMYFPLGAFAWIIIEALTFGERGRYSILNVIPFAVFMALFGAIAGGIILRYIFQEQIGKKRFAVLFLGNLIPTSLAITSILVWVSIYPQQVIA